jgi:hypothetical protein
VNENIPVQSTAKGGDGVSAPALADVQQFSIIGPPPTLTIDAGGDLLRGGHMRINAIDIVIARNTLLRFPMMFLPLSV